MDIAALGVFAATLFVAAAAPGPGIAALVARVLGRGTSGALSFTAGLAFGDVVWLSAAIGGLAVLAQNFHAVFVAVKWVGVAYLLYLALRMWRAPARSLEMPDADRSESAFSLFLAGLSVTLGNPKVMVFYLALLPNFIDLAAITALGFVELAAVALLVLAVVFGSYILVAERARRLLSSARSIKAINRASAGIMAGAAVWVASR